MSEGPERKRAIRLTEMEVPSSQTQDGPAGHDAAVNDGREPTIGEELKHLLDEEEQGLISELMRKVESAGELDKELNIDLSQFTERVESVVDSIERIENLERSQMERLLYKDGAYDSVQDGKAVPVAEPLPVQGQLPELEVPERPDQQTAIPWTLAAMNDGHLELAGGEPYSDVRTGAVIQFPGEAGRPTYHADIDRMLGKLRRLAELKLERGQINEAKSLVIIAMKVGGVSGSFQNEFDSLMHSLNMELPGKGKSEVQESAGEERTNLAETGAKEGTQVLAPELADEIGLLQKRASSALNQLRIMLESTTLQDKELEKVRSLFSEAESLYTDNRFHKSHQVALSALSTIKSRVQDNIDTQLQNELFQSREMLEEMGRAEDRYDVMAIEGLRDQLDKAMKCYLTNEYEKANLLVKTVMMKLTELKEPEGGSYRETVTRLRSEVLGLRDQNLSQEDMSEVEHTLRSVEELVSKRDHGAAARLVQKLEEMVSELRRKGEKHSRAKEIEIRLTNRIRRLSHGDYDLREVEKKLGYLKTYLQDGRYEDALVIGGEIEIYLTSMENTKKEMEAKDIFNELEILMLHVDEMDGSERLKESFATLRSKYIDGDHIFVKLHGKDLINTLRAKTKTLSVERAKRISSAVIESKLLMMKLRTLNRDTIESERSVRKAKVLLKEGNTAEGLRQLDKVNSALREELRQRMDHIKRYVSIYRDSLEVVLDRHSTEPITYHIRNKQVPLLRKMEELGRYNKALEGYMKIEGRFSSLVLPLDRKTEVESRLNDLRFELYKRKDLGLDITEPLGIYNKAQKSYSEGGIVAAEYLAEVGKRYYEAFLPV